MAWTPDPPGRDVTDYSAGEIASWLEGAEQRLVEEAFALGVTADPDEARRAARSRIEGFEPTDRLRAGLAWVRRDGQPPATLWWRDDQGPEGTTLRVDVMSPTRGWTPSEEMDRLVGHVIDSARGRGADAVHWVTHPPDHGLGEALAAAGFRPSGTLMRLDLTRPADPGSVRLVAMTEQRFQAFRDFSIADYAQELSVSGSTSDEEALEESRRTFENLLPEGRATAGAHLFGAVADGVEGELGFLWWSEDGPGTAWIFDIAVHEPHRGKGWGRGLLQAAHADMASAEVGNVVLNVFGHNEPAARLYASEGYRPVVVRWVLDLRGTHA